MWTTRKLWGTPSNTSAMITLIKVETQGFLEFTWFVSLLSWSIHTCFCFQVLTTRPATYLWLWSNNPLTLHRVCTLTVMRKTLGLETRWGLLLISVFILYVFEVVCIFMPFAVHRVWCLAMQLMRQMSACPLLLSWPTSWMLKWLNCVVMELCLGWGQTLRPR